MTFSLPTTKPNFFNVVRLRCLYCGKSKLQKKGAWFDFAEGCTSCNYRYEREVGYYTGSSWMINYTLTALFGIAVAACSAVFFGVRGLGLAAIASVAVILFGAFFFPFGNALWMYFDHWFHPLHDQDKLVQ